MLKNNSQQYGKVSKFFHWFVALLVLIQFIIIGIREYIDIPKEFSSFLMGGLHKPIGVTVLALMIMRFFWRLYSPIPNLPRNYALWEKMLARTVQFLLYVTVIVVASSGVLMSMYAGRDINMFGLFNIKAFEKNEELATFFYNTHEVAISFLIALLTLHILGALKHHFYDKDNTLQRML